jgi:hypothetical protein
VWPIDTENYAGGSVKLLVGSPTPHAWSYRERGDNELTSEKCIVRKPMRRLTSTNGCSASKNRRRQVKSIKLEIFIYSAELKMKS